VEACAENAHLTAIVNDFDGLALVDFQEFMLDAELEFSVGCLRQCMCSSYACMLSKAAKPYRLSLVVHRLPCYGNRFHVLRSVLVRWFGRLLDFVPVSEVREVQGPASNTAEACWIAVLTAADHRPTSIGKFLDARVVRRIQQLRRTSDRLRKINLAEIQRRLRMSERSS
jgi:hypothetical protein